MTRISQTPQADGTTNHEHSCEKAPPCGHMSLWESVQRERDVLPYLLGDLLFWAGVQSHYQRSPLGCGDGDHDHAGQNHDIHLK